MYSLVSAPALGFDLVRRPGGEHVAALLLAGLSLTPRDVAVLASMLPEGGMAEAGRVEAWRAVADAEVRRSEVAELLTDGPAAPSPVDGSVPAGALCALEAAPVGGLDGLLRCLRREVLDWTWTTSGDVCLQSDLASRATAVLCDAVAARYLADELSADVRRRLAGPWTRASRLLPQPSLATILGADGLAGDLLALQSLLDLLRRVARLDDDDRRALRGVADRSRRGGGNWVAAVHDATWAVHLTGRVRTAAAAQLHAVQAVAAAELSPADSASGVWNVISGAVQAHLVADVIDDTVVLALAMPVLDALGLPELAA